MQSSVLDVLADEWDERKVSNKVANQNRNEGQVACDNAKAVHVGVDQCKGLEEHENQGVGETRQER